MAVSKLGNISLNALS